MFPLEEREEYDFPCDRQHSTIRVSVGVSRAAKSSQDKYLQDLIIRTVQWTGALSSSSKFPAKAGPFPSLVHRKEPDVSIRLFSISQLIAMLYERVAKSCMFSGGHYSGCTGPFQLSKVTVSLHDRPRYRCRCGEPCSSALQVDRLAYPAAVQQCWLPLRPSPPLPNPTLHEAPRTEGFVLFCLI